MLTGDELSMGGAAQPDVPFERSHLRPGYRRFYDRVNVGERIYEIVLIG